MAPPSAVPRHAASARAPFRKWVGQLGREGTRALVVLAIAGETSAGIRFDDATIEAGIAWYHDAAPTGELALPEIMGGGVALFDADDDGDLDLFLVQSGEMHPGGARRDDRLFRNDTIVVPGGPNVVRFVDVTPASGIARSESGMGGAVGDVDGDGRTDLLVTGLGATRLFSNRGGMRFEETTGASGLADGGWASSAAFFDADGDGDLDLYLVRYVDAALDAPPRCFARSSRRDYCGPSAYVPVADRYFENRGDGRFVEASARLGLADADRAGPGLGVVAADFDGDARVDLYVANDGTPNRLFRNRGGGRFEEDGAMAGVATDGRGRAEGGMGVDAGDTDGDGDLDLVVANLAGEGATLYEQVEPGLFEDRKELSGVGLATLPWTGFGALLEDFDGDGRLDLAVANGAVRLEESGSARLEQPLLILRNDESGRFIPVDRAIPASADHLVGRGLAAGDVDDDGDVDLVVAQIDGAPRLLLNRTADEVPAFRLKLTGRPGDLPGARVELHRRSGPPLVRVVRGGGSYLSASDPRIVVPLQVPDVDRIRVVWPGGLVEECIDPLPGRWIELRRGFSGGLR